MKKLLISFFILYTAISCSAKKLQTVELDIVRLKDDSIVKVVSEVADSQEEREYGFMNRKKIPDGTGMIFVFEKDQPLSFWMKNTPTALSIAYIDRIGTIRDIFDMKPFSLEPISSTCSVRYALEVPKGWFEKNNIKVGDKIRLDSLMNQNNSN